VVSIRPFPQDPTACQTDPRPRATVPHHRSGCTSWLGTEHCQIVNVPPMSTTGGRSPPTWLWTPTRGSAPNAP